MARSFGVETPVLWYGPGAHANPGKRNERVWLLWPARAYRVVAPEPRSRGLNVLQKAVLGVLCASRLTAEELGARLGVHRELAAFVVSELQGQERVDSEWRVTTRGVRALEEEREHVANLVPAWVFRDPWNHGLWPYVARSLEHARTTVSERGYRELEIGAGDRPWRQRVWIQRPDSEAEPIPPDAREIVRAALQHARLSQRARHADDLWQEEDIPDADSLAGIDVQRVTRIEPEPRPVFLATYLYVPRDGVDQELDWFACDFFGRGASPELRRLIVRVAKTDARLAKELDPLIAQTLGYNDFEELQRVAVRRQDKARALLQAALTGDIYRHGVSEPLGEALEAWLEMGELKGAARGRHRRSVLLACRRALERLLGEVARTWPLRGVDSMLADDRDNRKVNEAAIRGAARVLGATSVPEPLLRVTRGQVRSVSQYDDSWRLRPLVVASLLRAKEVSGHPLRRAMSQSPDVLQRIERVTVVAGKGVHDSDDSEVATVDIRDCIEQIIMITGLLLGLPARPLEEIGQRG